jgi:MFS family permease
LLTLQFVFGVSFSTYFMLPKLLAVNLGAGPRGIGVVAVAFSAGGVVDRPGRPRLLARGSLLMALASAAFVAVDHVGALAVGLRFLQGFAYGGVFSTGASLAADLSPPESMGRTMGLFGSSNLVTNAIAPPLAEWLLDHWGMSALHGLALVAALASFALARRLVEPVRPPHGGEAALGAVLRRGRARRMVAVIFLTGVGLGTVLQFYQPLALSVGIRQVGSFFVAYTVAVLFVRFGLGNVVDRVGPQRATVAALVVYSAVVFIMRWLGVLGLVPAGVAFGVAHGFFFPAAMSLSVADLPAAERGRMLALANGAFIGGTALVMPLGDLAARAGYPTVFALGAACTVAAAGLISRWPVAGPGAVP